jgi:preflagellin peptidase FlaK
MSVNIPLILTIIAILACFYASYSDLRKGIIPNKLTFPLIGVGLFLNGIYAFMIDDVWFIISCGVITVFIFLLSYSFWKLGAWAGGDVKLFTALAALLPFYPQAINYTLFNVNFPISALYPFPFTLIINSLLSILPFLLIYVLYISIKTKPYLLKELFRPVKEYRKNIVLTLVITSAVTLTVFITPYLPYQIIIISLILIYLLSLIISKLPNRIKAVLISIVTVFALYKNFELTLTGIIILLISITIIGIMRKLITSVSKEALQDDFEIQDLQEGMISAYNIYQRDGEIYVDHTGFFDKFKEAVKTGNISIITAPKGKLLISTMAAGFTQEDIKLLKNLFKEGKVQNKFRIKKGVPFAPSIFIGLIISIFIGDLAFIIQKIIFTILYG